MCVYLCIIVLYMSVSYVHLKMCIIICACKQNNITKLIKVYYHLQCFLKFIFSKNYFELLFCVENIH